MLDNYLNSEMYSKYFHNIIIGLICVTAFFVYSAIYFSVRPEMMGSTHWIFNTPDETANYFFIDRAIQNGNLAYPEPLNARSENLNLVHPRSTTVVNSEILPGSFLGFIITMETLGKFLGAGFIPYMIPLISIAALFSFYLLLRRHFGKKIALISLLLLATLPAYWYYNSRSLFNNVLFLDFIIIGLYQLQRYIDTKRWQVLLLSGLIIGVALTIRTTDVVWVMLLIMSIIYPQRHLLKSHFLPSFVFFGSMLLAFIPVLQLQATLYGSPLVTGYVPEGIKGQAGTAMSSLVVIVKQFLLPFGLHPLTIVRVLYHYGLKMFWPYIGLATIGAVIMLRQFLRKKLPASQQVYAIVTILVSVFIAMYYGSWSFSNNLAGQALIGSSQVRYLLPIYILLIPAAAVSVSVMTQKFTHIWMQRIFIMGVLCMCLSFSCWTVLFKGPESLLSVRQTIIGYHELAKNVQSYTEDNSIIVSSYHDKVFFPQRKIIFYWNEPRYLHVIENLLQDAPIYFYSVNPEADQEFIKNNSNLHLEYISSIRSGEALYKIIK